MGMQYEWATPDTMRLVGPDELEGLDEDGNEARAYGLSFDSGSNGCMIYGSLNDLRGLALRILAAVHQADPLPELQPGEPGTDAVCQHVDEDGEVCGERLTYYEGICDSSRLYEWRESYVDRNTGTVYPTVSAGSASFVGEWEGIDREYVACDEGHDWAVPNLDR